MIKYSDSLVVFYLLLPNNSLPDRQLYSEPKTSIVIKQPYYKNTIDSIITTDSLYDINDFIEKIFIKEDKE